MILKHMVMIDSMTLASSRRPTSANAGSGVAGCDLAPCREMPEQTYSGLARTDAKNHELPSAGSDYSNRTDSLRRMTEATAFWGNLGWPFCRYTQLIRLCIH